MKTFKDLTAFESFQVDKLIQKLNLEMKVVEQHKLRNDVVSMNFSLARIEILIKDIRQGMEII